MKLDGFPQWLCLAIWFLWRGLKTVPVGEVPTAPYPGTPPAPEMIVVTISLGTAVVHTTLDGKVFVDPEFICHMVDHLHRQICPGAALGPGG